MPTSIFDVIALQPNRPFKQFYYRCDNKFHIDSFTDYFEERKWIYAIVIIEGEDANFYRADQKLSYELLGNTHGVIQKRQGRGGQSKNRIARLREETIHLYVKKITEYIERLYFKEGQFMPDKLILSGVTQKIHDVIELLSLNRSKIKTFNCSSIDSLIVNHKHYILYEDEKELYKVIQNEIKDLIETKSELLVFGEEVFDQYRLIETLYISSEQYNVYQLKIKNLFYLSKTTVIINDAVQNFGIIGVKYFNFDNYEID